MYYFFKNRKITYLDIVFTISFFNFKKNDRIFIGCDIYE